MRPSHLRAVLLVRPERAVKHDHPISVEAQLHRLLCSQLGPCSCRLHKTLSFASKDVQFPDPLQHQIKVQAQVGRRSICRGDASMFQHREELFLQKIPNAGEPSYRQWSKTPRCPPPRLNRTLSGSSETQRLDITINHLQHKPQT